MDCEKCGGDASVNNSRKTNTARKFDIPKRYLSHGSLTYRSVECNKCSHKFKTIEMTSESFDRLIDSLKLKLIDDIAKTITNNNK